MSATARYSLPEIVSRETWNKARQELLSQEKELTRQRDELNRARRQLPMVEVTKAYSFHGTDGEVTLADLFAGRQQLIVYHFMFDPAEPPPGKSEPWSEGCRGCSFMADHFPALNHLHARETSFVMISRARLAKISPFKQRMGWDLPWYSSFGSDFNYDYQVTIDPKHDSTTWNYRDTRELKEAGKIPSITGELPGLSVFLRDGERVFHTYSTYARGLDTFLTTYQLLDVTPFGRGEGWDGMPDVDGKGRDWLQHHDRYETLQLPTASCCHAK